MIIIIWKIHKNALISLRDKHWLKSCSTKNLNDAAFMHVNATDKQVITRAWCVQFQGEMLWRSDKFFFFLIYLFLLDTWLVLAASWQSLSAQLWSWHADMKITRFELKTRRQGVDFNQCVPVRWPAATQAQEVKGQVRGRFLEWDARFLYSELKNVT